MELNYQINKKNKIRVAVLVSGGGTNLQALIDYEHVEPDCPYTICLVLSDRKDAYALERAASKNIATQIVSPFAVLGAEKAKVASRNEKRFAVSDKVLEYCRAEKNRGSCVGWIFDCAWWQNY